MSSVDTTWNRLRERMSALHDRPSSKKFKNLYFILAIQRAESMMKFLVKYFTRTASQLNYGQFLSSLD